MNLTLCNRRWRLVVVPRMAADGECDPPETKAKAIRIAKRLSGQRRLEVLIHEMLHACAWPIDERLVTQAAEDIGRALWRLGYREEGGEV